MEVNRLRQIVLDIELLFWDLPLWIIEDITWKCKLKLKHFKMKYFGGEYE